MVDLHASVLSLLYAVTPSWVTGTPAKTRVSLMLSGTPVLFLQQQVKTSAVKMIYWPPIPPHSATKYTLNIQPPWHTWTKELYPFYLCLSRWWAWLSKPYLDGHSSRYMQVCLKPWPFFKLSCIHVQPTQCTNMQTHHSLSFLVSHTASPLSSLSCTHTPKETHVGGLTPGCLQCIQEYCY